MTKRLLAGLVHLLAVAVEVHCSISHVRVFMNHCKTVNATSIVSKINKQARLEYEK